MKKTAILLIASIISTLIPRPSQAASQYSPVNCRTKIIRDGIVRYEKRDHGYNFLVEVISDETGRKYETSKDGRPFITAKPEERYSIRLHNPLPVRVAVNLTIDGLNSITGEPSKPSDGSKWIIDPYSYVTIRGWQVTGSDARRFFFTGKEASYAKWQSNSWGRDLSVNCGVIGAAYFWNRRELEDYFEQHPLYEYTRKHNSFPGMSDAKKQRCAPSAEREEMAADEMKAGTGMGERESHPVTRVHFNYDQGMYKAKKAVIIYYDFAKVQPLPDPFPNYAPEMPY
ncbi:MAG: hypothetical protein ABH868_00805 [bacterium]